MARTVTTEATDGVVAGGGERNARTLLLLSLHDGALGMGGGGCG